MSQGHCGNVPAQRRQTVLHGAVQLGAVDIQTDAAQHRRVDLCLQVDGLAGEGFQLLVQGSRLLFGQGNGRGGRCLQNAVCLIVADAVSPRAAAKLPQGAFLAQDL